MDAQLLCFLSVYRDMPTGLLTVVDKLFAAFLFCQLSIRLWTRFQQTGIQRDLDWTIAVERLLIDICPHEFPGRWEFLTRLATSRSVRYDRGRSPVDLDRAIVLWRDTLAICPRGHERCSRLLTSLAFSLCTRFKLRGKVEDLDEAIKLQRAALALISDGHSDHPTSLENLGVSLSTRFQYFGNPQDLTESILVLRNTISCLPEGHPSRPMALHNLASCLLFQFEQSGNMDDLEEAVQLNRDGLALRPHGHPDRPFSLSSLASSFQTRFERSGNVDDLNGAVLLHRDALALWPYGHPNRSAALNNLATSLQIRFRQSVNTEDLNEAVRLHRDALDLRPNGHLDRSSALNNLAASLCIRFEHGGSMDDLNEAILLHRDALALRPHGHPNRASSLNNLAAGLQTRFEQNGDMDDLNETIPLLRAALALRPPAHPDRSEPLNNLANSLCARFEQGGSMDDLDEAVQLYRNALDLLPHGHPARSGLMSNTAKALYTRFQKLDEAEDFEECIRLLAQASGHAFSSTLLRFNAAYYWASIALNRDHSTTLAAYRTAISLLQRALTVEPDLNTRHDLLNSDERLQTLCMIAASYAVEKGDLAAAIELLEQGRALLWSQMRDLRTPLGRLKERNGPLADRFRNVSNQLEALMTSSETRSASPGLERVSVGSYERRLDDERMERIRRLSEEQEAVIGDIRKVHGFEDFLQAASFEKLREVATEGPVVVINHSYFRCDALVILPREDTSCVCVPLDKDWFSDARDLCNDLVSCRYKYEVQSSEYDETLRRVMKVLWDRVVSKVAQKLDELGITEGSRIWWCPTSYLSVLPFHTAGPYVDANGATKYLLDDYVSSYTPTLTSLIAARSRVRTGSERFLFVGDTNLKATMKELANIRKYRRVGRCLLGDKANPDSVTEALRKVQWVHFACHGKLDQSNPYKSSFALPTGELTLLDIVRANLPNAEFAFLSACHTAEQRPAFASDEALHLAAAIQFCGFRSVIGTMWQLLDRDGPILADAVYFHLMNGVKDGELRFKGAAAAVREAALHLRRSQKEWSDDGEGAEIMAERWVNLVHIGA